MTALCETDGLPPNRTGGYSRHIGRGEKPCDPCRLAYNAHRTAQYAASPETRAMRRATVKRWRDKNRDAVNAAERARYVPAARKPVAQTGAQTSAQTSTQTSAHVGG